MVRMNGLKLMLPYPSKGPYFLRSVFLLNIAINLNVLVFAIFSNTASRIHCSKWILVRSELFSISSSTIKLTFTASFACSLRRLWTKIFTVRAFHFSFLKKNCKNIYFTNHGFYRRASSFVVDSNISQWLLSTATTITLKPELRLIKFMQDRLDATKQNLWQLFQSVLGY